MPKNCNPIRVNKINLSQVRLKIEKQFLRFQFCKLINQLHDDFMIPESVFAAVLVFILFNYIYSNVFSIFFDVLFKIF